MSEPALLVDKQDGYRVLTLNRPKQLNAFDASSHDAMRAALDEIEADKTCRALLLTGAGRAFCAGQDLSAVELPAPDRPPAQVDLGRTIDEDYNPMLRRLRALPMPVICAVNGMAAGGGANIAFSCDIVLAARSAQFLQAFAKIGLIPDCGGTWLLPHLAGPARARGMALLAEPITAETAERWGLIWKVYDDELLMGEAYALCAKLAKGPTSAYAATKRALDAAVTSTFDAQLDRERDVQRAMGREHDFNEGVRAFLEKRPAKFTGAA